MKLIIDIDDELVETARFAVRMDMGDDYVKSIANGISLDDIKAEIKQLADKQFQIAMGVSDLNERYAHIQMENAYRHSLNIIDKYKAERSE